MADQPLFVDVTYRGLRIAERARFLPGGGGGFLETFTPMPVGTRLELLGVEGGSKTARVVHVAEQEAGAEDQPGMRLAWDDGPSEEPPAPASPSPPGEAEAEAEERDANPRRRGRRGRRRKR